MSRSRDDDEDIVRYLDDAIAAAQIDHDIRTLNALIERNRQLRRRQIVDKHAQGLGGPGTKNARNHEGLSDVLGSGRRKRKHTRRHKHTRRPKKQRKRSFSRKKRVR